MAILTVVLSFKLIVLLKLCDATSEQKFSATVDIPKIVPSSVPWLKIAGYTTLAVIAVAGLEQLYLFKKKGYFPGPRFILPFIGSTVNIIRHPYQFWLKEHQRAQATGISWNYVFGKFMMLCTKVKYSRIPFIKNSESEFVSAVHPNAAAVFNEKSILLMPSGPEHTAIRQSFIKLFTRKAISAYLSIQDEIARESIQTWMKHAGEELDLREHLQEFNARSSHIAFLGPYLKDFKHFQRLMTTMGQGFSSLPINFPGSGVWHTIRARKEVESILEAVVRHSKENMCSGKKPQCLVDFWTQNILNEIAEAEQNGQPPPVYSSDFKMAITVMDFLFAAQDASTSSLAQSVALMSDYPDILAKVREEQERVNPKKEIMTYELLKELTYTRQVAREILRFRPPVPMWAHVSVKDNQLEEGCIVPKGTYVFSSITSACHEGFVDPSKFDPDRFGPERQEHVKYCTNYLVFGAGPHMCAGKEYAINHIIVFLSVLSTTATWKRRRTPRSDEIEYLPSAYPADLFITFN